ncbi:hypothetical protein ACJX0J_034632, partial [Zea mays]
RDQTINTLNISHHIDEFNITKKFDIITSEFTEVISMQYSSPAPIVELRLVVVEGTSSEKIYDEDTLAIPECEVIVFDPLNLVIFLFHIYLSI